MSARGLRFASTSDMPPSLRDAAEKALHKVGRIAAVPQPAEKGDVRRKYGNKPTVVDGIRFDSKREALYYERLKAEQEAGLISYFHRQVPIRLPGGTRYICDFLVVYPDSRIRYLDAKGKETPEFRIKKREVEHHFPFEIECV